MVPAIRRSVAVMWPFSLDDSRQTGCRESIRGFLTILIVAIALPELFHLWARKLAPRQKSRAGKLAQSSVLRLGSALRRGARNFALKRNRPDWNRGRFMEKRRGAQGAFQNRSRRSLAWCCGNGTPP